MGLNQSLDFLVGFWFWCRQSKIILQEWKRSVRLIENTSCSDYLECQQDSSVDLTSLSFNLATGISSSLPFSCK